MTDNPSPSLEEVRNLIEQIAEGYRPSGDILHQDLRPENVIIDHNGTAKLIDFGAARVAGIAEAHLPCADTSLPGTALYMAPEYFLGESGSVASDLYSLAVITYHLLSGRFPYGTGVARARTIADQRRLNYQTLMDPQRPVPAWIDHTLRRALRPTPTNGIRRSASSSMTCATPTLPTSTGSGRHCWNVTRCCSGKASGILALILMYALLR